MEVLCRCTAAAALAAALAACGGPPDDVADAARQSRMPAAQAREAARDTQPQRATAQRERSSTTAQRPVPRDLPPAGTARDVPPATTAAAGTTSVRPSTAVMGAAPAGASAESAAAMPQPGASAPAIDDALITARVRGLLNADHEVGPLHLDVDTRAGVVTLSGTVPTAAARARAGDLAKSVKDVRSLNDQLTLVTG